MKTIFLFASFVITSVALAQRVDSHVHVNSEAKAGQTLSVEHVVESMKDAMIDRAVLLSEGYSRKDDRSYTEKENNFIASVSKTNSVFIGFCGVPVKAKWALEEVERCAKELKLRGLKIHPLGNNLDLRDDRQLALLGDVFSKAEEHNLPIIMDSAWLDSRATLNVFYLARSRPKTKIILAHSFFTGFRDLFLLAQLYRLSPGTIKNIYVDMSATIPVFQNHPERDLLVWHLREFGIDRVFFGSDYPVFTPRQSVEALKAFGFSADELNGIMGANFEREIIGIPFPPPNHSSTGQESGL